jgi:hypothetical protein
MGLFSRIINRIRPPQPSSGSNSPSNSGSSGGQSSGSNGGSGSSGSNNSNRGSSSSGGGSYWNTPAGRAEQADAERAQSNFVSGRGGSSSSSTFTNPDGSTGKVTLTSEPIQELSPVRVVDFVRKGGGSGGSIKITGNNAWNTPVTPQMLNTSPVVSFSSSKVQGSIASPTQYQKTVTAYKGNNYFGYLKQFGSVTKNRISELGSSLSSYLSPLDYKPKNVEQNPFAPVSYSTYPSGKGTMSYRPPTEKEMNIEQLKNFQNMKLVNEYTNQIDYYVKSITDKYTRKVQSGELTPERAQQLAEDEISQIQNKMESEIKLKSEKIGREYEKGVLKANYVGSFLKGAVLGGVTTLAPPVGIALGGVMIADTAANAPEVVKSFARNPKENLINLGLGVAGGYAGGGGVSLFKKPSVTTQTIKPKIVSRSVDVSDAIKVSTNPDGSINWMVKGDYITEVINPKTGKVINTIKTQGFSQVITSTTKEGAINAVADTIASSYGKGAIKTFKSSGNVKITQKVNIDTAKGNFNFNQNEMTQLLTGTGESQITSLGKGFVKMSSDGSKSSKLVKSRLPSQSSGLFNIDSRIISQKPSSRNLGLIKQTGTETKFLSKILGDVWNERFYVKGYKRDVSLVNSRSPFMEKIAGYGLKYSDRVKGYLRTQKSNKQGAKSTQGSRDYELSYGRSFSGEDSIFNLDKLDFTPSNKGSSTPSSKLLTNSEVLQQQASIASAQSQLSSIVKNVKSNVKPIKQTIKQSPFTKMSFKTSGVISGLSSVSMLGLKDKTRKITKESNKTSTQLRQTLRNKGSIVNFPNVFTGLVPSTSQYQPIPSKQGISITPVLQSRTQSSNSIPRPSIIKVPNVRSPSFDFVGEKRTIPRFETDERNKRKKGFIENYGVQVRIDATRGQKARWVTLEGNAPKITALSLGAGFVDENESNKFRLVKPKGKATRLISTTWNVLQNKFREYSSKGGVRVSSRPVFIERQRYRMDRRSEQKRISNSRGFGIAGRFGRF